MHSRDRFGIALASPHEPARITNLPRVLLYKTSVDAEAQYEYFVELWHRSLEYVAWALPPRPGSTPVDAATIVYFLRMMLMLDLLPRGYTLYEVGLVSRPGSVQQ